MDKYFYITSLIIIKLHILDSISVTCDFNKKINTVRRAIVKCVIYWCGRVKLYSTNEHEYYWSWILFIFKFVYKAVYNLTLVLTIVKKKHLFYLLFPISCQIKNTMTREKHKWF